MATMNVSLPDPLKKWVEKQVKKHDFSNTSDFMRDLVRKAKEQDAYDGYLRMEINRGLTSEFKETTIEQLFADVRAEAGKPLKPS
jgi:antitoxin ParD1/3/4